VCSCKYLLNNENNKNNNGNVKMVIPSVETTPAVSWGDNADDIAIWVNEKNRKNSLIFGTLKREGLAVYNLDGKMIQFINDGKFNNVDIRYNFNLNNKIIDILAASNRTNNSIALYGIDKEKGTLFPITDKTIYSKLKMVYGICMYHNENDNEYYVFVTSKNGFIEQWKLFLNNTVVDAEFVRNFKLSSQLEGCVADDEQGFLFVGEEEVGVWRFYVGSNNDISRRPVLIDKVGKGGHLNAEVEGLALYTAANGHGYLIVSSQGASRFDVFNRRPPHEYVGGFKIVNNKDLNIDEVTGTDGIDVINLELNKTFKYGLFIAQDDENRMPRAHQDFKFVPWENIAESLNLIKDNKYVFWH
jgi:3-phytase